MICSARGYQAAATFAFVTVVASFQGACHFEPAGDTTVLSVAERSNQTPYVASKGELVAVAWSADQDGETDLFLAVSADGGRTFSEPRRVNDVASDVNVYGEQPPRVALGGDAEVYVAWTSSTRERDENQRSFLRFARSRDGGRTFEPAVTLHYTDLPGDRGWHSLAVAPGGEVHTVWLDSRPDGGNTMGLYHAGWDGGASPRAERLFDRVCECCKTSIAIGEDGSIYTAWRNIYEDNYRDIAFASSRDSGRSFENPVRVHEDGWQINGCPDDGPSMAVDSRDRVHLVWPTLVKEKMDMGLFTAFTDDGLTFSPRISVPTAGGTDPSHPQMSLDGNGNPVVVWDEVIAGKRRIAMTRAQESADGAFSWSEPLLLDDGGEGVSSSYPVPAPSGTGILVAWTSQKGDESVIQIRRLD